MTLAHFMRASVSALRPNLAVLAASRLAQARCYALDAAVKNRIDDLVQKEKLFVFMKGEPSMPMCGFSKAVIQVLEIHGVEAEKVPFFNVLSDEEIRQGIKEYSEWPTIPQVFINGEFVGGCDLMIEMHQNGELDDMLEEAGVARNVPTS